MTGVPGEIVSVDGLQLVFGPRARQSPYDPLLQQLVDAGPGRALKFGDARARVALTSRAKKMGLRISFAISGDSLYVRLDGGVTEDVKATRRGRIKEALKFGTQTAMHITNHLREKGDSSIDVNLTESILLQMLRTGDLIRQEDGRWKLNPMVKGATA
jgi:hypothetical protein